MSDAQLTAIWSQAKILHPQRGETLVRQHAPSNSVFVVVSGRFEVWVEGQDRAINEIGIGEPIGEVGFFSGAPRTATVIAARDSVVLELDRVSFDRVAQEVPAIHQTLLSALARRVADNSGHRSSAPQAGVARTIAVIAGGREPLPRAFFDRLTDIVGRGGKGLVLSSAELQRLFPGQRPDEPTVSNWLNAIENDYNLIAYMADDTLTDWTRKAIRQADQVVVVVSGDAPDGINPVEDITLTTGTWARASCSLACRTFIRRSASPPSMRKWSGRGSPRKRRSMPRKPTPRRRMRSPERGRAA